MFEKEKTLIYYIRSHFFIVIQASWWAILGLIIGYFVWTGGLRNPFVRWIHSDAVRDELTLTPTENLQNLDNNVHADSFIRGGNVDVQLVFQHKFDVTARVLNVTEYGFWGSWVRGSRGNRLYDKIAPFDVAWGYGAAGLEDNFKKMDIMTDYRYFSMLAGFWMGDYSEQEINNNIIIPATRHIEKGLSLLEAGELARFEGYIITIKNKNEEAATGLASTQGRVDLRQGSNKVTKQARIIYLTRLTADGRAFQ